MVRVGQMLFAEVLKRHKNVQEKEKLTEILTNFSDFDEKAVFSIQNITRKARLEYGLKPGDWYNPSQIAYILSELYSKKGITGYEDLAFKVFHSGNLFFDQMI